jgi:hypothetical protein
MKLLALFLLAVMTLAAADVAGNYSGTVEIPAGVFQVTLTLEVKGSDVTGAIVTEGNTYPLQKGQLSGNKVTFEVSADQVYAAELVFDDGRLAGDIKPAGGGGGKISVVRNK